MTMAELFAAAASAGVRFQNVCGRLRLAGPQGAISEELRNGAAKHKAELLSLLPDDSAERAAIKWESELGDKAPLVAAKACEEWDAIVRNEAFAEEAAELDDDAYLDAFGRHLAAEWGVPDAKVFWFRPDPR